MMIRILSCLLFLAAVLPVSPGIAQPLPSWQEHSGARYDYNLSGIRILVIAADQFNDQETTEMARCWRGWGADVEVAGPGRSLIGETEGPAGNADKAPAPTLTVDHLLEDVDPARYDLVYIAGGEGIPQLLAEHRPQLARIVDAAARSGRLVAAICHGPLALTASSIVKGRRMTANGETNVRALKEAGAAYVDQVVVIDGRLITGQWPHLETFAVTVGEKLQYPSGDGPFQRANAARPPAVRLLDDLRRTARFEPGPLDMRLIEQAIQASMRTIARSSRGPATVKYLLVTDGAAKTRLWERMVQASSQEFSALGLSEQNLRRAFGPVVESASGILFAFVEAAKIDRPDARDRLLRADTVYAGASIANFVIAARGYGLGIAALDYTPFLAADADIKRVLEVPDAFVLVNIICVGRPAAEAPPIPVRPVSEVLSYERWSRGGTNVPR